MDVVCDASAGGFAEVHAEIEAIRVVDAAERGLGLLGDQHHLVGGVGGQGGEGVDVQVGNDQDVAG